MKIAVITDSTAYISAEQIGDLPIRVVTTPLIIGGHTYNEGVDISTADFYEKMAHTPEFPKTAQPRLGDVMAVHEELKSEGYDTVINLYLSSAISGIHDTSVGLAKNPDMPHIVVYDSHVTVAMLGEMVLQAGKMAKAGAPLDDILHMLDTLRASIGVYFVVDNLQHLVRGGRLSSTAGFLGGLLNIKPILTFDPDSHKIVPFEKARTSRKALARVEELFAEAIKDVDYPIKVWVIDANAPQPAAEWLADLKHNFPNISFSQSYIGPAIGTHVGAGTMALGWMRDLAAENKTKH